MNAVSAAPIDLAEQLAGEVGCEYISDLKWIKNPLLFRQIIEKIPAEKHSLFEWQDMVSYLTDKNEVFETPFAAKDYLLSFYDGMCR